MPDRPLFPEPSARRDGPLGFVEPPVRWLTTSTRPQASASRAAVNDWYAQFPDTAERKFAKRLKSRDPTAYYGALDELYVHHLLRQRYDDVRYEEGGVGPDFRAYESGQCVAAVEVVSLFEPADWTQPQIQHGRIADRLNEAVRPTAGYFVHLDINRAPHDPSPKRLAGFVRSALAQLPPPEQLFGQLSPRLVRAYQPRWAYEEDSGVRIDVVFHPMYPHARSRTDPDARITGSGPLVGRFVMTAQRLKARVKEKAGGRYDIGGIPFAVAVGVHEPFADDEEILEGLYGRDVFNTLTGTTRRDHSGLFGADAEKPAGRHRRVSAVVVLKGLPLWDTAAHDAVLLRNPHAERAWPKDAFPARALGPQEG